ncbi:MAG: hypothetical protein ACK5Y6_05650 [Pseudomonadota bacterium]|jgi:hypothetical protein
MSLISFRNLALPLQSKVQVGALLIITLLVLVIRLGIGSVEGVAPAGGGRETPGLLSPEDAREQDQALLDLLNDSRPKAAKKRQEQPPSDEVLDDLVDGTFDREAKQERQRRERGGESFDDIRKTLGL